MSSKSNVFDYVERIIRLRRTMERHEVDGLLLSSGADLPYFTAYEAMPLERLTMLVVPLTTDPTLVVPELEAPRVKPGPFEIRPWAETEDPIDIVGDLCQGCTSIAIGDPTWSVFLLGLQAKLPTAAFRSATPITRTLRAKKDSREVEFLRRAAAGADRVSAHLAGLKFSGHTEQEISRLVTRMTLEEDHDQALFWIVASGPNSASPHHEPTDRVIEPGDLVVVDFGGKHRGYCSDTTRTFSVGEPNAQQVEVHAAVRAAQEAATAAVAPGVSAEEIDQIARRTITDAGYGDYFIHRTGHGIGLEGHEHPYLVEGNSEKLEPGMCFSIEPGIYLPDRFGVRIEDIVTVTDVGVESLNQANRALVQVG
ncbi:MAG TPA: Xaa-Pro peptidase family protein [Acidimicrobiia bacterium]|nr:Xaa-Pro peptidase family protein [Acidimicrobiia bacterium]